MRRDGAYLLDMLLAAQDVPDLIRLIEPLVPQEVK